MKPLIPYYGGKQRMASKLLKLLPPHTVYVEPFAGGAALLFAKPKFQPSNNDHYREVLNDTDEQVVNLYRMAVRHPEELNGMIQETMYARSDYERACRILRGEESAADIERAWAVVVGVRMAFARTIYAGWGVAMVSANSAATWNYFRLDAANIIERLTDVYVEHRDALHVIDTWDSPQTVFYCDPPYPGTDCDHYRGYQLSDLQALVDKLDTIQGSFLLSNYDQPEINFPTHWERHDIAASMSAAGGKYKGDRNRTEIVWRMDRSENARSDLTRPLQTAFDFYQEVAA